MIWSVIAVVVGSVAYGLSTVIQALAVRRSRGLAVIGQPLVLLGLGMDLGGWLLSLAALDRLPLFVVQAVLASSLAVVVLVARPVLGVRLRGTDAAVIVAAVLALVVLGLAGGEQAAGAAPRGFVAAMIIAAVVVAAATGALYRVGAPVVMAVLAGLGFSVAALAARAMHAGGGIVATVWQPVTIAVVVAGVGATLAYLRALESGPVGLVAAIVSVVEVVVPGALGILVLDDTVRSGWQVPGGVAFVIALGACVLLASSPAHLSVAALEAGGSVDEVPTNGTPATGLSADGTPPRGTPAAAG